MAENAKNAAFKDTRFRPVNREDVDKLKISVSLLTPPKRMGFTSEEDLLNRLTPNLDGLIIKDGDKQAVFLPSVWEQIPDKREFLKALKVKAGLNPEHFSQTFEAYTFEAIYIKEE